MFYKSRDYFNRRFMQKKKLCDENSRGRKHVDYIRMMARGRDVCRKVFKLRVNVYFGVESRGTDANVGMYVKRDFSQKSIRVNTKNTRAIIIRRWNHAKILYTYTYLVMALRGNNIHL